MDHIADGGRRMFDLHELEELRLDTYENALIYKERKKYGMTRASQGESLMKASLCFYLTTCLDYFL